MHSIKDLLKTEYSIRAKYGNRGPNIKVMHYARVKRDINELDMYYIQDVK